MKKTTKPGFTLVELLVVISILAILSLIGITVYADTQVKARDARRRADIDSIAKAWEQHYRANPPTGEGFYPALSAAWFADNRIPSDPKTGEDYSYGGDPASYSDESVSKNSYRVCADLESEPGTDNYCHPSQQ